MGKPRVSDRTGRNRRSSAARSGCAVLTVSLSARYLLVWSGHLKKDGGPVRICLTRKESGPSFWTFLEATAVDLAHRTREESLIPWKETMNPALSPGDSPVSSGPSGSGCHRDVQTGHV